MTEQAAGSTDVVEAFLDAFAAMDFDTALSFPARRGQAEVETV